MIELVIPDRRRSLGGGFEVGRVLPHASRRMVGPFVFFDHMGPIGIPAGAPRTLDVRPHPHIGLSTVTYLFAGEIMHRDSLAFEQPIRPGEVNWMTAGRGITHSERFEKARREGDFLHGIQAWVALPEDQEECDPAFVHHGSADLPAFAEDGVSGRLIAGEIMGLRSPVAVMSPLFYLHLDLAEGARTAIPASYPERAVHVTRGAIEVGGARHEAGQMLVLAPGDSVGITALQPSTLMALGGESLGPRFIEWNFVSSRQERIEDAKSDWRAGRMKLPDLDHEEFIPLPPDPAPPPTPMS